MKKMKKYRCNTSAYFPGLLQLEKTSKEHLQVVRSGNWLIQWVLIDDDDVMMTLDLGKSSKKKDWKEWHRTYLGFNPPYPPN